MKTKDPKSPAITEALNQFQESIKNWKAGDGNHDLDNVYAADRKQLRIVLILCRQGEWIKAKNAAHRLDTIVRDVIPQKAWDLMQALG